MYIAMNRFKVAPAMVEAFEETWKTRESFLKEMPGFVEFHMLKGSDRGDHILYASHTVWQSRDAFEAWTQSESFAASHRRADASAQKLFLGHPEFEGFDVFQHIAA